MQEKDIKSQNIENMSLSTTIVELRKQKGWTQLDLSRESGVKRGAIANIESNKNGASPDTAKRLADALGVSVEMLEKASSTLTNVIESDTKSSGPLWNDDGEGVPYYDIDVFAGDVIAFNDMNFKPIGYIKLPGATDCDFGCRVSGNSMTNKIYPGAIILCKEIRNKDIIAYGEVHLIATEEQRLVKFIRKDPERRDWLLLRSLNPDYDDVEIKRSDILRLFLVKIIVNQEQM